MSLRSKILLILSAVFVAYVAVDHAVQRGVFTRNLAAVERTGAEQDLRTVIGILEEEQRVLAARARDWACRTAVLAAADGGTAALEQLASGGLAPFSLDLVYVCAPDGTVRYARSEDGRTREAVTVRELPRERLSSSHQLLRRRALAPGEAGTAGDVAGLLMTERGGLIVGSAPIVADGADLGTVVLGRWLDEEQVGRPLDGVRFRLHRLGDAGVEAPRDVVDRATSSPAPVHWTSPEGDVLVYTTLRDVLLAPTILLETRIAPLVSRAGGRMVDYALVSAVGTGVLNLLVLLQLLRRIVVDPLSRLTAAAVRIGRTDDTSVRTDMRRPDEIGQLSAEFDAMLEKLEASRREVIRTARLAGMSEIATGVLHNVGNVLNSVNVSANLVTRRAEQLPVDDLLQLRDVLRENERDLARFVTEDPRGAHMLPFLDELAGSIEAQRRAVLEELRSLNRSVEHMGDLVRSQQSFAGRSGVLEPTSLQDQLNAAVSICRPTGSAADVVEVVREYADLPKYEVDRHKLMEILVNLVKNAYDALREAPGGDKRLTLRLTAPAPERIRIEVADSGPGIAAEDLTKVFAHGYTTKSEGHGYGLHVSANAAAEMKGRLVAESAGRGRGATFVLELPARPCVLVEAA